MALRTNINLVKYALPWPQKGADVTIPLGTRAKVTTDTADGDPIGIYSTDLSGYKSPDITPGSPSAGLIMGTTANNEAGSMYCSAVKLYTTTTGQRYPLLVNKQLKIKRSTLKAQPMMNSHSATKNATQNIDISQALLLENSALTQPELSSPGIMPRNTHHYRYSEIHGSR